MKHIKTVLILCLAALMLFGCASNHAPEANAQTEVPEAAELEGAAEAEEPAAAGAVEEEEAEELSPALVPAFL